MKYDPNKHVYIISYAKIPSNIAAAVYVGHVGLGFIINYQTGVIEDISCTLLTKVARGFLKNLIVGYNIRDNDVTTLIENVKLLFHGQSQKAVCVIIRDNYNKYIEWHSKNKKKLLDLKTNDCYNINESYNINEVEMHTVENMKKYPENSVYIISYSKIPQSTSLAFYEGCTGVGFVIDFLTNTIIDCCCTFITKESKEFIKSLTLGCRFDNEDTLKVLVEKIKFCYIGASQKAVSVIVKDNYYRYHEWKQEHLEYVKAF